jgi:hypothetical protein
MTARRYGAWTVLCVFQGRRCPWPWVWMRSDKGRYGRVSLRSLDRFDGSEP